MPDFLREQDLAELQTWRTVSLLRNSHIELTWDWYTFYLRTADLLVLHQTLTDWFEHEAAYCTADVYTIHIGREDTLTMTADDLADLADLVETAVAELPRRTVRWIDNEMTIEPHPPGRYNGPSHFSLN